MFDLLLLPVWNIQALGLASSPQWLLLLMMMLLLLLWDNGSNRTARCSVREQVAVKLWLRLETEATTLTRPPGMRFGNVSFQSSHVLVHLVAVRTQ